jgi:tetratricopeptide (TPR) repeat protein
MRYFIRYIIASIISSTSVLTSSAQNTTIDSLKTVLNLQKQDTNSVSILNEISNQYLLNSDYDNSLQYANNALSIAEKLDYPYGKALAHKNLAQTYMDSISTFPKAKIHFHEALKIFEAIDDKRNLARCYALLGNGYRSHEFNIPEAQKNFMSARRLYEDIGDKTGLAHTLRNLSIGYIELEDTVEALKASKEALQMLKEIPDSNGMAYTYNIIGNIYSTQHIHDTARSYFLKALEIYSKAKKVAAFGIPWTHGNLGEILLHEGELALKSQNKTLALAKFLEAEEHFKTRLKLEQAGNMSHRISYNNLGQCYLYLSYVSQPNERKRYQKWSEEYFNKAIDVAKKEQFKPGLESYYYGLSELYSSQGSYKEAYNYYKFIS